MVWLHRWSRRLVVRERKGASVFPLPQNTREVNGKDERGSPLPCKKNRGQAARRVDFRSRAPQTSPSVSALSDLLISLSPLITISFVISCQAQRCESERYQIKELPRACGGGFYPPPATLLPSFTYSSSGTSFSPPAPACLVSSSSNSLSKLLSGVQCPLPFPPHTFTAPRFQRGKTGGSWRLAEKKR